MNVMSEFDISNTEPTLLLSVANATNEIREQLDAQAIEVSIDMSDDKDSTKLRSAFSLGLLDHSYYLEHPEVLSFQQLLKVATIAAEKTADPSIIQRLLAPRVSPAINLEDFIALRNIPPEFFRFPFGFLEKIGWQHVEELLIEATETSDLKGSDFFDALKYYVASENKNILRAVELLLAHDRCILAKITCELIGAFIRDEGVALKVARWIVETKPDRSVVDRIICLTIDADVRAAQILMPLLETYYTSAVAAGQNLSYTIRRQTPSSEARRHISALPDNYTANFFSYLIDDAICKFGTEEGCEAELNQSLSLATQFINLTHYPFRTSSLLESIARYGDAQVALDLYEQFDQRWFEEDFFWDHYYLQIRRKVFEQANSSDCTEELEIIKSNIEENLIERRWAVTMFVKELSWYADEDPESVMKILEEYGLRCRLTPEITNLLRQLESSSVGNRAVAWRKKYLQLEEPQSVNPAETYMDDTELNFENLNITVDLQSLRKYLLALTPTQQQFAVMALEQYGLLSQISQDYLEQLPSKITILKTGSDLEILARRHVGVMRHKMSADSAGVWIALADEHDSPIAVAPVLKTNSPQEGLRVVYSRVCGESLKNVLAYHLGLDTFSFDIGIIFDRSDRVGLNTEKLESALYLFGDENEMLRIICQQTLQIFSALKEKGVVHGHEHLDNFTVEFIEREYLENHLNSAGATVRRGADWIKQPPTINNVPWSDEHFTFDTIAVQKDMEKWVPVVRLIDFDQARYK